MSTAALVCKSAQLYQGILAYFELRKLSNKVVNELALEPCNKSPASVLKLFDSLKVLGYFEDLTSLRRPLKAIIYRNNRFFKRRTYDLNDRLLSRMGEDSYNKWKVMIKNSKKD